MKLNQNDLKYFKFLGWNKEQFEKQFFKDNFYGLGLFFENKLKFDVHLVKLDCSSHWVESKVLETVKLLRSNTFPKPSSNCEFCNYLQKRWILSKRKL